MKRHASSRGPRRRGASSVGTPRGSQSTSPLGRRRWVRAGRCRRCPRVSRRWRSRTRARRPRRNPGGVPPGERMVATMPQRLPEDGRGPETGTFPSLAATPVDDAASARVSNRRYRCAASRRVVAPTEPAPRRLVWLAADPTNDRRARARTQATHDRGSARSGVDRDERVRSWPAWPHAMGARDDSDLERLNRRLRPLGLEVTVDDIGGRGRCLRATRTSARGELALSSAAFASHLLSSHLTARCAGCFRAERASAAMRVVSPHRVLLPRVPEARLDRGPS